jgi:hypothetical protein
VSCPQERGTVHKLRGIGPTGSNLSSYTFGMINSFRRANVACQKEENVRQPLAKAVVWWPLFASLRKLTVKRTQVFDERVLGQPVSNNPNGLLRCDVFGWHDGKVDSR